MPTDPIKKIKSHTFCGHKYRFRYADPEIVVSQEDLKDMRRSCKLAATEVIVGATDDNSTPNPEMIVSDQLEELNPKELLRVLLDEGLHGCNSRINNDIVAMYAESLSNFLWRCGYRRQKKVPR
jgi:hypothetical protein